MLGCIAPCLSFKQLRCYQPVSGEMYPNKYSRIRYWMGLTEIELTYGAEGKREYLLGCIAPCLSFKQLCCYQPVSGEMYPNKYSRIRFGMGLAQIEMTYKADGKNRKYKWFEKLDRRVIWGRDRKKLEASIIVCYLSLCFCWGLDWL